MQLITRFCCNCNWKFSNVDNCNCKCNWKFFCLRICNCNYPISQIDECIWTISIFPRLQIDIDIFCRLQSHPRLRKVRVSFRDRVNHIHNQNSEVVLRMVEPGSGFRGGTLYRPINRWRPKKKKVGFQSESMWWPKKSLCLPISGFSVSKEKKKRMVSPPKWWHPGRAAPPPPPPRDTHCQNLAPIL